jgi:hypothetical protein
MSQESERFRFIASRHLRKARMAATNIEKVREVYLARVYKMLAHDEERHRGEPEKSRGPVGHAMASAMRSRVSAAYQQAPSLRQHQPSPQRQPSTSAKA